MTTLAINKLWSFLQSLSLTAGNERRLAERLLESAEKKSNEAPKASVSTSVWTNYKLSAKITDMTLCNRKEVSDREEDALYEAIEEKYR